MAIQTKCRFTLLEKFIRYGAVCVVAETTIFIDRSMFVNVRTLDIGVTTQAEVATTFTHYHRDRPTMRIVAITAGHFAFRNRVM